MNVHEEIERLKYQMKLMRTIIAKDEFPFYLFLLDHHFTEQQTRALHDVLYLLNHRMKGASAVRDEHSISFYNAKVADIQQRYTLFSSPNHPLYADAPPSYRDFVAYASAVVPKDVNPDYLLMALSNQEVYPDLCQLLLSQK
ncbi:Protein of unknown function [Paenibacillus algorifonticola]|uniref:HSR domain-containing protein n=1 Tax=Paenibacillus algorifonticola TaxID=684063 RepID=A0A1I2ILH7_9BACL|nr:DUF1878 family protein [Paenibacillus algorifonticola]SFF41706.1 Protein of unknown function [Paenibacillus algorifonticola]